MATVLNPEALEAVSKSLNTQVGGVRVTSLVFNISVFTREPFTRQATAVLAAHDAFFAAAPRPNTWFYASENMSRHKPATERAMNMLHAWLKPKPPEREFIALELHGGPDFNSAPDVKFEIRGTEPGSASYDDGDANLLSFSFPADWALTQLEFLEAFARRLFAMMPLVSGHAGFSVELSRYFQAGAEARAWQHSMRHRGIDINRPSEDRAAVASDGLKSVSWLTFLGSAKSEIRVPSAAAARAEGVLIEPLGQGILIKAGSSPALGNVSDPNDLPEYRRVFAWVKAAIERTTDRYPAMWVLGGLRLEPTKSWLFRLEK
jgi:hypothetical protein